MTFSIGCRAPSKKDVLGAILEQALMDADPDDRYADPLLGQDASIAGLGEDVVAWAAGALKEFTADREALRDMLGTILSQPRRWVDEDTLPQDTLAEALEAGGRVRPGSSSQVLTEEGEGSSLKLFAAGEVIEVDGVFRPKLEKLILGSGLTNEDLGDIPEFDDLLDELYGQGTLVVDD